MFMASTMKELLLSVHGIEMKFTTNSSELAHSVWALLRHFHRDTVAAQPMRMEFDAIELLGVLMDDWLDAAERWGMPLPEAAERRAREMLGE